MDKENKRSVEMLHHFHCENCGKWWSIGDAPKDKHDWFCPWCGTKQDFSDSK